MSLIKLYLIALLIIQAINIQAQEASTAAGGNASGSGGTISFSIGQVVYTANSGTSGSVSQGVQQPYEIFSVGLSEESPLQISLAVYPNPTTNSLTLMVEDFTNEQLTYQLVDVQGKLLAGNLITSNQTLINMSSFSEATYFVQITQENKIVKSFKVVKN